MLLFGSTKSSRPKWLPLPELADNDSGNKATPSLRTILSLAISGFVLLLLFFRCPLAAFAPSSTPSAVYAPLTASDALLVQLGWRGKELVEGYQISTVNQSFADYLAIYPSDDLIWITLADVFYSQTCTPHLQHFVNNLEPLQAQLDGRQVQRKHTLVTLCIDPGCMDTCREKGWNCYGEYEATRPDIIFPATWPKLSGLIDILETGRDAIFVDSDVFFRSDPFEKLAPLGTFDWQIQDEAIDGTVNTGFFHIMPTPETIAHWKGVVEMDMAEVSRDQHNTNILLGTTDLRIKAEPTEPGPDFVDEFVSKNGISVKVIPPETVYAWHVGLSWPQVQWTDAVAWHGTCLSNREYKYLLPREHGYWQDVDQYYSQPPNILVLPFLTGTQQQILQQFNHFVSLAIATNRSMVPPATVNVILDNHSTVTRSLFAVFPMQDLVVEQGLPILEADYISHALPYHTEPDNATVMTELLASNPLRTRAYKSVQEVAERLQQPDFAAKRVVTLVDWEANTLAPGNLPKPKNQNHIVKETCYHLEQFPGCDRMCRRKTDT